MQRKQATAGSAKQQQVVVPRDVMVLSLNARDGNENQRLTEFQRRNKGKWSDGIR